MIEIPFFPVVAKAATATPWYEQPITGQDISDAVTHYAPGLPPSEFAAFVTFVAESWEGVIWQDATAWDMAAEWRRFTAREGS